jgi:hypothetical protein
MDKEKKAGEKKPDATVEIGKKPAAKPDAAKPDTAKPDDKKPDQPSPEKPNPPQADAVTGGGL